MDRYRLSRLDYVAMRAVSQRNDCAGVWIRALSVKIIPKRFIRLALRRCRVHQRSMDVGQSARIRVGPRWSRDGWLRGAGAWVLREKVRDVRRSLRAPWSVRAVCYAHRERTGEVLSRDLCTPCELKTKEMSGYEVCNDGTHRTACLVAVRGQSSRCSEIWSVMSCKMSSRMDPSDRIPPRGPQPSSKDSRCMYVRQ
nr:hypothetical protein Iba_chr05eCG9840 [Ipomoea batatas]